MADDGAMLASAMTAARRPQRRVLQAAAVASVLSGIPSVTYAVASGSPGAALRSTVSATRAIATIVPPGRPGLVRGAALHAVISLAVAEVLAVLVPREHAVGWGAAAGLAVGVLNLRVIAPRRYPELAALALGPQLADHAAFGIVFAAVADRTVRPAT